MKNKSGEEAYSLSNWPIKGVTKWREPFVVPKPITSG